MKTYGGIERFGGFGEKARILRIEFTLHRVAPLKRYITTPECSILFPTMLHRPSCTNRVEVRPFRFFKCIFLGSSNQHIIVSIARIHGEKCNALSEFLRSLVSHSRIATTSSPNVLYDEINGKESTKVRQRGAKDNTDMHNSGAAKIMVLKVFAKKRCLLGWKSVRAPHASTGLKMAQVDGRRVGKQSSSDNSRIYA